VIRGLGCEPGRHQVPEQAGFSRLRGGGPRSPDKCRGFQRRSVAFGGELASFPGRGQAHQRMVDGEIAGQRRVGLGPRRSTIPANQDWFISPAARVQDHVPRGSPWGRQGPGGSRRFDPTGLETIRKPAPPEEREGPRRTDGKQAADGSWEGWVMVPTEFSYVVGGRVEKDAPAPVPGGGPLVLPPLGPQIASVVRAVFPEPPSNLPGAGT